MDCQTQVQETGEKMVIDFRKSAANMLIFGLAAAGVDYLISKNKKTAMLTFVAGCFLGYTLDPTLQQAMRKLKK